MKALPPLYAIADAQYGDPVRIARELMTAGVRLIQIRYKDAPSGVFFERVRTLMRERGAGVRIIVNDRVDVARVAGADGVHLGQTDLPADAARAVLGSDALIGLSTHDPGQASRAVELPGLDYIAAGPVFPTASKGDAKPPMGLDGLEAICRASPLPVVAIGGIRLEQVSRVLAAGARSVAVVRDLIASDGVAARAREFLERLDGPGSPAH